MPTIAALVAVAILASLGVWQLRRHAWRQQWLAERSARIDLPPAAIADVLADPGAFADRRATARGRFLRAETIVVRQVPPGLEGSVDVLTPLALSPPAPLDAPVVLVRRGSVAGPALDAFLAADLARESEETTVTGLVQPISLQPVAPGSAGERQRDWQRFAPARPDAVAALQAQISRPLAGVWLEAAPGPPGELPAGRITRPVSPVDHVSYALFWFSMAGLAVAHWVGFGFHRAREAQRAGAVGEIRD